MTALVDAITPDQTSILVDGGSRLTPPFLAQIDGELVLVSGGAVIQRPVGFDAAGDVPNPTWEVVRGVNGTGRAPHAAEADVTPVLAFVQTDAPAAPPPAAPAGGGAAITISDTEPESPSAYDLWLNTAEDDQMSFNTLPLMVRNAANDAWLQAGFANAVGPVNIDAWSQDGNLDAYSDHSPVFGASIGLNDYGTPRNDVAIFVGLGHAYDRATLRTRVAGGTQVSASWVILQADPTAGAGIQANAGSFGTRDNAGVGELWLKTGATDTDWTQLAVVV